MKKIILLLSITCLFANQMQVDGNLKVTGQIDASNYQIKNVGPPTDMFDAVNAQVLQDALRNDMMYEYKFFEICVNANNTSDMNLMWSELDSPNYGSNWTSHLLNLTFNGWQIHNLLKLRQGQIFHENLGMYVDCNLCVLKREINE